MAADRTKVAPSPSRIRSFLVLVVLASAWTGMAAAGSLVGRIGMKVYTSREGLPQDAVLALALDAQSRLWAGTVHGLARYDGRGWTSLEAPVPAAMLHVNQNAMACLSDGSLWIGTRNQGLLVHRDGRWSSLGQGDGLPSANVNGIVESEARGADGRRIVWIATYDGGLARWEDGRLFAAPAEELRGQRIFALQELSRDGERELWAATDQGLFARTSRGWRAFPLNGRLPGRRVRCLAVAPGPVLWAGFEEGGAVSWNGRELRAFAVADGLAAGSVYALLVGAGSGPQRRLWAAVAGAGLASFDGGSWSMIGLDDGLPTAQLRSLAEVGAPGGPRVLWMGTDGRGVLRWQEGGWRALAFPDADADRRVVALATTTGGAAATFWFGTQTGGIWSHGPGGWRHWTRKDGLPNDAIRDLKAIDFQGRKELWAATNGGLARLEGGRWRPFGPSLNYLSTTTRRILDSHGPEGDRVWVATSRGLLEWDGGTWTNQGLAQGLPSDSVRCLALDRDPAGALRIWAGTDLGLARRQGGAWHPVPLAEAGGAPGISALAWCRGPRGRPVLVAGCYGGGFVLLGPDRDEPLLRVPSFHEGALHLWDSVVSVVQDRQDRIYLGTLRGIHRLVLAADGGHRLESFVEEDGLPALECTQSNPLVDGAGRIWIGTTGGPAFLDPGGERLDRSPKPLLFRRAAAGGLAVPLRPGQDLPPDSRSVAFEYVLVAHYREAESRFRTQMAGFETAPTEWSTETGRRYSNLPPGAYTFRVWAQDYAGNASGPLEFPFRVRAPWWASAWARILGALGAGGLAWLLLRLRLRVLQRRNELLAAQVAERTREVTEQKEALERLTEDLVEQHIQRSELLRIVAHDLRNPLNHIQLSADLLLEDSTADDARNRLGAIQRSTVRMTEILTSILSREAIESGRMQLHPAPVELRGLLGQRIEAFGEQLRLRRMQIDLQAPAGVSALADPDRLGEVVDNLLSNAIKYSPEGARLGAAVAAEGDRVLVRIQDAGPGIPAAELPDLFKPFARLSPVPVHGDASVGLGLSIVKRLVEAMGGTVRAESEVGRGTTMVLSLPRWGPER